MSVTTITCETMQNGTVEGRDTEVDQGTDGTEALDATEAGNAEAGTAPVPAVPSSDYPTPHSVLEAEELEWDEDAQPINNYRALGQRLAAAGDLYRRPGYASGLLLAADNANIEPVVVDNSRRLAAIVVDRVRVRVVKGGESKGAIIPVSHLSTMLASEVFLQQFRPVDDVVRVAHYLPDFSLPARGYNDGGPGQRLLYAGPEPQIERSLDAIMAFLDVMEFATNADRTNALALALTVKLRNFWPGAKPVGIVTSTKSHGGKDTIIAFASGSTPKVSIDYQSTDWAFRHGLVATLKSCPDAGVLTVENARLGRGDRFIASATLERSLTDSAPVLHSTKARDALKLPSRLVVTISTNFGSVSEDLMNRGLPIHLAPRGNVADRVTPIGNPKLEYLPQNRERIEAELRGMIETWKEAGQPLDTNVKHPFTEWAHTIGGILRANGFSDFLANYSLRRTVDDPLRRALGLLGAAQPDAWLRADAWARLAVCIGVDSIVIPPADRRTDSGRERGMGVVLSAHQDETFDVATDDETLTLRLE
ncbi:MAG TPA: hypothetical protein VF221_09020, partial [Chloroflexota bacterium]